MSESTRSTAISTEEREAGLPPDSTTAHDFTVMFTRLRHVLASGIRHDVPWESLPMAQVEILQQIERYPGTRLSEIAYRQRLAVNTVSTIVTSLVRKRLVTRTPDPLDKRATHLTLSNEGRTALKDWMAVTESFVATAFPRLDEHTLETIRDSIPALVAVTAALEDSYGASFRDEQH